MMKEYFIKKEKQDMTNILKCCQSYFRRFKIEIDIHDILSLTHRSEMIFYRALIVLYLRKRGLALSDIAEVLEKKTHATIFNAAKYGDRKIGKDDRWDLIAPRVKGEATKLEVDFKIEYHLKEIQKLQTEMPIV